MITLVGTSKQSRSPRSLTANGLVLEILDPLFQEHRPEPVASESIVFLSEKMMERSTSRSLFCDLADGES